MVVDIGGGTVDITVHDKSNGRISVVLPPMGNTWGGTTVNEALSELLQEIVEDKGFEAFIESDARNKAVINNFFLIFVFKGEEIKDEVYKATLIPRYQRSTQTCIPIYCTSDDGVQYIRNKEGKLTVRKIGQLVLDIPNPDNLPREEREYDVLMDFSGTEIQARAQYSITGKEVKTVCDFLSKQD